MGINTRRRSSRTTRRRSTLDFTLVAMPYTLLDQASLHTGMAACLERDVSVIIGAPFASGILVTGSRRGAKYAYGKAPAGNPGKGARHRGGVQGAWRGAACRGVAIPARPPGRRLDHSRRRAGQRGDAEHRPSSARRSRRPSGPTSRAQDLIDKDAPVPAGRLAWASSPAQQRLFLSARGISKQFAGVEVLSDVDLDLMPRRNPCAAGRERRGQIDLRQDHRRRAPARRAARWCSTAQTRGHRHPDRGAEARHHADPPGADFLSRSFGGRKPDARPA